MNERIRELMLEARIVTKEGKWGRSAPTAVWAEKFAELIIAECCEVVNDAVDHREPASTYAAKIQKYFGVDNG